MINLSLAVFLPQGQFTLLGKVYVDKNEKVLSTLKGVALLETDPPCGNSNAFQNHLFDHPLFKLQYLLNKLISSIKQYTFVVLVCQICHKQVYHISKK